MSVSKEVTTKSGVTKNVIADNDEDLKEAISVAKGEEQPIYPNINKPVQKGHDKVDVQGDLSVLLRDGTGAHNSPNDAINSDGKAEGAWDGSEEPEFVEVPKSSENGVVDGKAQESDLPPQAENADGEMTTDGRQGASAPKSSKSSK